MVVLDTMLANSLPDDRSGDTTDALAIDQALDVIEATNPRLARVVELRFFNGMTFSEVAEALGLAERTVERY